MEPVNLHFLFTPTFPKDAHGDMPWAIASVTQTGLIATKQDSKHGSEINAKHV